MRGRLNPLQIQVPDPINVLEDPAQLPHHRLHFLVGEAQAGKPGDVQNLIAVDHARDSMNCINLYSCWV